MNPLSTRPNRWRPITVFNLLVGLLFSLSALGQPAFLKEGLVAYYPFNGNANDESGNALNLQEHSVGYGTNRFGAATSSVRILNNSQESKSYLSGNGFGSSPLNSFSISFWAIMNQSFTGQAQYVFAAGSNTDRKFAIRIVNNDFVSVELNTGERYYDTYSNHNPTYLDGVGRDLFNPTTGWNHYLLVYDGKSLVFYKNSQSYRLKDRLTQSFSISGVFTPYPLIVGKAFSELFEAGIGGGMDDVRIYNRALSNNEVKALYDYESTPPDNSFITNGLVAYYPFNGNANDESGNGRHGRVQGAVLTSARDGRLNQAYQFSGAQYIEADGPIPIGQLQSSWSVSCWLKADQLQNGSVINDYNAPTYNVFAFSIGVSQLGSLAVASRSDPNFNSTGNSSFTASTYAVNEWIHASATFNPATRNMSFFKNGVYAGSADYFPERTYYGSQRIFFGASRVIAGMSGFFVGSIDDVRIYNRALSDSEVKSLYDYESTSQIQSPVFVNQPFSQTVNSGANVVLSVGLQAAGAYNYQWQLNEQNIAGATASSLSINNAVAGVYRYRVIVSNSAGTVISDTANLTVSTPPAPSIVTQPAPKTVQEGANVSFNVLAAGQGAIVYQWQFNEQNLPGATSATLNLNGVKLNTAGRYRVLVSSQYGVTISDTVTLTVNPNPPPTIVTQPISRTPAEGTQVSLTATATGLGSLTYQWQINNQNIPGATSSTLVLNAVRPSANGNYRVIVGNPYGTTISTEATVTVIVTDSDSDGLSDYEELLLGTNSNKSDSDGDGLSDFAEIRTHKSNPLTTDTDGDGYSDGIEVARDGNPNNRSVTPTGALAVFPAVDVEFYTLNSVKYQLEVSTDMVGWTAQGGVVVGNGGSQNHLVRAAKATQFWRLKVVQ